MAMRKIKFEEKFQIKIGVAGEYLQFINKVRQNLGNMNENSKGSSHTSPALPDVKALFDLILSIDKTSQSVRFRFRTEDIYLIGFKMEPNGIWYAFDDTKQLIQGSQSLGFDSTYKAKIVNMSIGFESLKQAIINLATGNDRNARPHDLTIAIMMTSESVRFKPVAELMQCALHKHDKPLVIESWVEQLVHNWEDLCEFVHLSNSKSGVKNEELKKIQKRLEDKHLKVPYNFDRDRPGEKETQLVDLKIIPPKIIEIMGIMIKFKDE
ncbi:uncharacterized protein LOC115719525 [Cannabis sativa]|uniref:rRNA N-glycosylase n=1 Tax=Cannabis sativa TaxID=3483 RepID=A0A7J6GAF0_CANSA|nr:uncharacterized protein LOC115719525 [Cannabis sativa]KAF4379802.1 hypothetical protein F8388_023819 [Cannabis sativa]